MISVSLIGEQPIPNLLPIRYQPPDTAVFLYTDYTEGTAERLKGLLPNSCEAVLCRVAPYDIPAIVLALRELVREHQWETKELLFNLTGGTKAMMLAASQVAASYGSPFIYLQSEGRQTRLYRYAFDAAGDPYVTDDRILPSLIEIDDYIRAFVDEYQIGGFAKGGPGGVFEEAVYDALQPAVDEIVVGVRLASEVDIDLVVRCDNQIGIIEVKKGSGVKKGIDQLNTAGGRSFLGTYTRKMLVSDQEWDKSFSNHQDLADARWVTVIQLPSFGWTGQLSSDDVEHLRHTVCQQLGREVEG